MMLRKRANAIRPGQPRCAFPVFLVLISVALFASGCGVPGEPVPPSPPIPQTVTDLAATQLGDGVLLTFTLPSKSTRNEKLTMTPTLEILRGSVRPDGLPDLKSLRVVDTVPGSVLGNYIQTGQVQFLERYAPEEAHGRPGQTSIFSVRTRVSEKKASANSNVVVVSLFPVPAEIDTLQAKGTEKSIDLTWTAPTQTSAGDPLSGGVSFFIYRGELDPASEAAAEKDLHAAAWKAPLLQIGTSTSPQYQDTGFDWGKTYVYTVRSAMSVNGTLLQSGDSRPVILTPKDIFPPAAPEDLVFAVLPGDKAGASVVDLSWAINLETDLAGYRVYRSELENEKGQLLTPKVLPSPAYRDSAVISRGHYWYRVTAVDQAGNESAPSAALFVEIP